MYTESRQEYAVIDWRQRSNDVLKTLGEVQKNILEKASDGIQRVAHSDRKTCWIEGVTAGEDMLKSGLKAQADLATAAVDQVDRFIELPGPAKALTHRIQHAVQDLTLSEASMLANGADLLRIVDPLRIAGAGRSFCRRPVRQMRSMTRDVLDRQMDLARGWARAQEETE
jgi:hypothetical protein